MPVQTEDSGADWLLDVLAHPPEGFLQGGWGKYLSTQSIDIEKKRKMNTPWFSGQTKTLTSHSLTQSSRQR